MKTLAVLTHPHILAIYDVGREGSTAYAVTELLEGETLAEVVARGPLPIRRATEYGVQIARALGAAHERGIVHRPAANVSLPARGTSSRFRLARSTAPRDDSPPARPRRRVCLDRRLHGTGTARGLPVDHRADLRVRLRDMS
jgi:hypothetical protein